MATVAAAADVDGAAATGVEAVGPIGRHGGRLSYSMRMKTRTDALASRRKAPGDIVGGLCSDDELDPKDGKRTNTEVVSKQRQGGKKKDAIMVRLSSDDEDDGLDSDDQ